MSNFKLRALMGASALIAASALAMGAQAQTLNGAGSTLLAPAFAKITGCWDSADAPPNGEYFNKPGGVTNNVTTASTVVFSCAAGSGAAPAAVTYAGTGSGAGQAILFAHDGSISVGSPGVFLSGFSHTGSGLAEFVAPQYGLSDNALADADVGVYVVGTGAAYTPPGGTTFTTAAAYQGIAITAAKPQYGALVQFPVSIDPVDLAYNPTGIVLGNPSGKLVLDRTAYCGIYQGTITNWNDPAITALNGPQSSIPIEVVGRADSSGTTAIFTRHLSKVCGASNPWSNGGQSTLPTVGVTASYVLKTGSGAVAAEIAANAGAIGYLGNDYIATASSPLPVASLVNNHGDLVAPSGSAAAIAYSTLTPPSTATDRANPLKWVESPTSVALGDPTATGVYPIVGTTNFIGYTCYASVNSVNSLRDLLTYTYSTTTGQGADILTAAGLASLPSTWTSAIISNFVTGGGLGNGTLLLAEAVTGKTDSSGNAFHKNATCTVSGIVGG